MFLTGMCCCLFGRDTDKMKIRLRVSAAAPLAIVAAIGCTAPALANDEPTEDTESEMDDAPSGWSNSPAILASATRSDNRVPLGE